MRAAMWQASSGPAAILPCVVEALHKWNLIAAHKVVSNMCVWCCHSQAANCTAGSSSSCTKTSKGLDLSAMS
eukprot:1094054-Prorocentrum_lima.AAC.1